MAKPQQPQAQSKATAVVTNSKPQAAATKKPVYTHDDAGEDDFVKDLIKQTNKESGSRIAFNLSEDDAPTNVKRWIGTGSRQLDYIIANRRGGGLPEGRIIEVQGPPSVGKTHLAYEMCKATQQLGGIVVYVDTENATSVDNLHGLGIDIRRRFMFVQETCMEEIFKVIESTIEKARNLKSDIPVLIVWDSIAASAPKAEIEGDYDQNTIGLAARVLSKGFRKITHVIGDKNICLVLLNQQRTKIGVMYGDPLTTSGGMAIPYHASVRLKITGGQQLKKTINGKEAVIGIEVEVKTIKNKVARPWRQIGFEIHFGKGIYEDEHVLTEIARYCRESKDPVLAGKDNSRRVSLETGAWNTFTIADNSTGEVIEEVKFRKSDFGSEVLRNPKYTEYVDALFDACYIMRSDTHATVTGVDTESATELEAARLEAGGKQLLND